MAAAIPKTVAPKPIISTASSQPVGKQWFEPEMVTIPSGSFTMGCDLARDNVLNGCFPSEKPAHPVTISSFQMGKTEVTFEQWDVCAAAGWCIKAKDEGWGRGKRPVINISWNDIQTYVKWLNKKTGRRYKLPTEAQWEYAARANRNTAYPWGNLINCNNANYWGSMGECKSDRTKFVASNLGNAFGLHDTSGNVTEWVADCWKDSYQGASATGELQQDCANSKAKRVLRGCSWNDPDTFCRTAHRNGHDSGLRATLIGFRLSLGL